MWPARIAVPTRDPGLAPGLHQPTTRGFRGTSNSPSGVVATGTIGATALSFGIAIRFGDRVMTLAPLTTGTVPITCGFGGAALLRPQYGEVILVRLATATTRMVSTAQAIGTSDPGRRGT